jgi:hypothetical protein
MTTENPTTTKELTNSFLQGYTSRLAKELSGDLELVSLPADPGAAQNPTVYVLRFRYGRQSEEFAIQGETKREQLRDLGVHIERFLGARA